LNSGVELCIVECKRLWFLQPAEAPCSLRAGSPAESWAGNHAEDGSGQEQALTIACAYLNSYSHFSDFCAQTKPKVNMPFKMVYCEIRLQT